MLNAQCLTDMKLQSNEASFEQRKSGESARVVQGEELSKNLTTLFSRKLDKSNTSILAAFWGATEKASDDTLTNLLKNREKSIKEYFISIDTKYREKLDIYEKGCKGNNYR